MATGIRRSPLSHIRNVFKGTPITCANAYCDYASRNARETWRLTDGRYGQIELDPDLRTHDIAALGAPREVSDLSVGTREQLATLIRLAIAAHLQTALVLDDQLVHSDSARLNWFRERLRSSVREHCHQVIVFTCRPGDYLSSDAQVEDDSVTVVDLEAQLAR